MVTVIWVAAGGAVGSLARYGLAGAINVRSHPWGTIVVNIAGSLMLGYLVGIWGFRLDEPTRVGLAVGVLGGFTTFSAFSVDVLWMWEKGEFGFAVAGILLSVLGGIAGAAAGLAIGRAMS